MFPSQSPELIHIRFIGVIGDGELLVIARENGMRPYPPKVRTSIVAHLDELNTGGLTLPYGSGFFGGVGSGPVSPRR